MGGPRQVYGPLRGSALPRSAVAGPTSRCKGNTRARKYETEMLILIGEKVLKRSVSDGQALTGCRAVEYARGSPQGTYSFDRLSGVEAATPISRPAGQNA